MKSSTCVQIFKGHCHHWGLTEAAHALVHAQGRLIEEVYQRDMAAGHAIGAGSESSVSDDGTRLEALLRDEGYLVVPITPAAATAIAGGTDMGNTKSDGIDIERRRREVARLVTEGHSERQIASLLDVSRTTVWTDKQILAGAKS